MVEQGELPPYCQGPDWKPLPYKTQREGTCGACGKPLEGRNRWFCRSAPGEQYGDSCRHRFAINHWWGEASRAAIERDNWICRRCSSDLSHPAQSGGYDTRSLDLRPEVNHIVPRDGAGYGNGCHHHQDNLETLCHKCHLLTTAEQRGHVPGGKQRARRASREERDQEKLRRWQEWSAGQGLQEQQAEAPDMENTVRRDDL